MNNFKYILEQELNEIGPAITAKQKIKKSSKIKAKADVKDAVRKGKDEEKIAKIRIKLNKIKNKKEKIENVIDKIREKKKRLGSDEMDKFKREKLNNKMKKLTDKWDKLEEIRKMEAEKMKGFDITAAKKDASDTESKEKETKTDPPAKDSGTTTDPPKKDPPPDPPQKDPPPDPPEKEEELKKKREAIDKQIEGNTNKIEELNKSLEAEDLDDEGKEKIKGQIEELKKNNDKLREEKDKLKTESFKYRTERMLTETSYSELKELGAKKAAAREDGKRVYQQGKNYMLGYYQKKYDDAEKSSDKFEMKLMKKEIDRLSTNVKENSGNPYFHESKNMFSEATIKQQIIPNIHAKVIIDSQTGDLHIIQRRQDPIEVSTQQDVDALIKALKIMKVHLPK